MKRFVLFDLDGTLLNSMPYHARAWMEVLEKYGIPFEERDVYINEGALEFEVVKKIFESKGISVDEKFFNELFKEQKKIFKTKYSSFVKPYPGVVELLEDLKTKGKRLALVTSSHKEVLGEVVSSELLNFFDVVLTGDSTNRRKPHPEPYLKALSFLKAPKEDAVVVENSPAGVHSAKNAGLFCIAITTTLEPEYLCPPADLIVENHEKLREVLLNGKKERI